MNSARLRHRLLLQNPTDTPDANLGVTRVWPGLAEGIEIFAEEQSSSSSERWITQKMESNIIHRYKVRYDSRIKHSSRFVLEGRILTTLEVTDWKGLRQFMFVTCMERKD